MRSARISTSPVTIPLFTMSAGRGFTVPLMAITNSARTFLAFFHRIRGPMRIEYHLCDAFPVPEIDKYEPAQVPMAGAPNP